MLPPDEQAVHEGRPLLLRPLQYEEAQVPRLPGGPSRGTGRKEPLDCPDDEHNAAGADVTIKTLGAYRAALFPYYRKAVPRPVADDRRGEPITRFACKT